MHFLIFVFNFHRAAAPDWIELFIRKKNDPAAAPRRERHLGDADGRRLPDVPSPAAVSLPAGRSANKDWG